MPNPSTTTEAPANTKEKKTAYLICEGALCECVGGSAKVKLKVTSHKKAYINGDKLVATEKDVTFDSPGNFGTCSFMTSPYNTCAPSVQQWLQPYKDIEVENNKVITDKSEMMCTTGGKIKITKHGQTQDVNADQANNMDRTIAAQVNSLADLAPIAEEDKKVSVLSITGALVDDPKYKPVSTQEKVIVKSAKESKTDVDPSDIHVRPGQEIKFTANIIGGGVEALVCWKLKGSGEPKHFLQHGPMYQTSFSEVGKYTIEGYGTNGDHNLDVDTRIVEKTVKKKTVLVKEGRTESIDCMLDILVQENKLIDIRHLKSKNIIDTTNKNVKEKAQIRIGVPATFEPVFLMPPIQKEIDELILVVMDESGTELQRTKGEPQLVFVPKNSAAKYAIKAYFEGAEAAFISYPFASSLNSVNVIATSNMKVENEKIRPGTFVKFTVQNSKFMDDTVAAEIIETENTQIKWYENSETIAGTGPSYENTYQGEGKYTIVCRVTEGQPGWFAADKNDADDRTFYVSKNYPTAIEKTTTGISKVGRKISFELKSFFKIDYTDKNTIHWILIGPETKEVRASSTFEFTPTKKGVYKLYVSMNGGTTEDPFEFECTACEIIKGWWTDGDGNMLTGKDDTSEPSNTLGVGGWGQEVCVAFKHIGLGGENVTIEVWDKDKYSTTSVFKKDITVTDGYTVMTTSIKLDDEIKKNVAKNGLLSDGLLYFTVTVNNGLKVINNGMVLPLGEINYLKVDDTPRAKAYFSDNNDTKRYSTASTDMPVYVQVKSRNLIGDELELIIYKSIWGLDKKYEEKIAFKVDKYGMTSVRLDMCIFNEEFSNTNDPISIYVKVLRKSDSEELYSSEGKYPLTLYKKLNTSPASTNTTKAFVMVDTSKGKKNEGRCKYCDENITSHMLKSISSYATESNINAFLSGFNDTFKDFKINTCLRRAHFLAQIFHESASLKYTKEIGGENASYAPYYGRGLIQLTTESNYKAFGKRINEDVYTTDENRKKIEKNPYAVMSAGFYWENTKLNSNSDNDDFIQICRSVNGGFNGFEDRLKYLKNAFKTFEIVSCSNFNKEIKDYKFEESKVYNSSKASFAWGYWNDPELSDVTSISLFKTRNKEESIKGYKRFLSIISEDFNDKNWYGVQKQPSLSSLLTDKKNNLGVTVNDSKGNPIQELFIKTAVEYRLKELLK